MTVSDRPPNIGLQRTSACGLAAEAGSFGVLFRVFALAVVSLFIGSAATMAGADWSSEPASYRDVPWCATEKTVRAKLPTSECNVMAASDPEHRYCNVVGLFPKSLVQVSEVYEFRRGRLASISVNFDKDSLETVTKLMEIHFGRPTETRRNGERVWRGRRVTLSVGPSLFPGRKPVAWFEVKECS